MASAECSFSKLKIIKISLRSTILQDRLDGLLLHAIENECAKQLNMNELIDTFANNKARIGQSHEVALSLIMCTSYTTKFRN